ncbi:MAG TPA: hypothetical protein VGL37_05070 [Solirubrobacteraceae bacterium]|jgi:hypothetical protein
MDSQSDSWHAVPHSTFFTEWARLALGDTRQVYARDRRQPEDAPLVYMPENEAHSLRAAARAGHLICPVPGCPHPELTTRHFHDRRDHFAHTIAPEHAHADFPAAVTQKILRHWAVNLDPRLKVLADQRIDGVPVSVLVSSPSGRQVALCYTPDTLGAETWEAQHGALERAGVAGVWLFPPRPRYFSPPRPQPGPRPAENHGLVLDRHLFKVMRRNGSWPLIINIERQEVANLIVPRRAIAARLRLPAPPYVEDVLHLVVSPLAGCHLCKDGITTLAVNERDLEKIRSGYLSRRHVPQRTLRDRRPVPRPRPAHTRRASTQPAGIAAYSPGTPQRRPHTPQAPTSQATVLRSTESLSAPRRREAEHARPAPVSDETGTPRHGTGTPRPVSAQASWPRMRRLLGWLGLYRATRRSAR